jgi:hypothetical protein
VNNLPQGGTYLAGASFDSPSTPATSLYIVDGYPSVAMQKYNMATDVWATRNEIPTNRAYSTGGGAAAAIGATRIYMVGSGIPPYPTNGKFNEQYTILTDAWTSRVSMPMGRLAAGAAAKGNLVFVVGGAVPSYIDCLEIYNAATDSWMTGRPRNATRVATAASLCALGACPVGSGSCVQLIRCPPAA